MVADIPDTPINGDDPEINHHPVIRGCLHLIDIHTETLRRIEDGARFLGTPKDSALADQVGAIDVTDEIKRRTVEELVKIRELIERIRRANGVTEETQKIVEQMKIPPPPDPSEAHAHTPSAEHAAEAPDDIVQLPGDR